jgi:hypothetical protein
LRAAAFFPNYFVNAVAQGVRAIYCKLLLDVQQDQDATRQPNGESQYIDGCVQFVPHQIADRDNKVIFDHDLPPVPYVKG